MSPLALDLDPSDLNSPEPDDSRTYEDDSDYLLGHLNALLQFLDEHLDFDGSLKFRKMVMGELSLIHI